MRVLALSGSLRRDSYNTRLLRAPEESAQASVELEL
jgi:NAD(P)H-dependent FMN reductase